METTPENDFQPFTDRLSRDIRNDLSKSFVDALEQHSIEPARRQAERYLRGKLAPGCREYIDRRLQRYRRILAVGQEKRVDPLSLFFILWDEELFFEIHEVLEPLWRATEGEEKLLYQALIRAAGAYIKYEAGYRQTAARIGAKAVGVLERNRNRLEPFGDTDALIAAVVRPSLPPPGLRKRQE